MMLHGRLRERCVPARHFRPFASARAMPQQMHGSRRSVSIRESGPFTGRGSCRRPGFHGWLVLRRILGGGMLPAASSQAEDLSDSVGLLLAGNPWMLAVLSVCTKHLVFQVLGPDQDARGLLNPTRVQDCVKQLLRVRRCWYRPAEWEVIELPRPNRPV